MTKKQMFEQIKNYLETAKLVTKTCVDWDESYEDLEDSPEGFTAICNADELFIDDEGRPNWENIRIAEKEYGMHVHAGERDSFGWLSGICELKSDPRRSIIFG